MTGRNIIDYAIANAKQAMASVRYGLRHTTLLEGACEKGDQMFVVDSTIYIANPDFPLRRLDLLEGDTARIVKVDINPTQPKEKQTP